MYNVSASTTVILLLTKGDLLLKDLNSLMNQLSYKVNLRKNINLKDKTNDQNDVEYEN